jgi:hypothetical protein
MSQNTLRNSLHGYIESAGESLLKEKDWHEQQIARIEFLLENMKQLAEGKPFGEKGARRVSRVAEEDASQAA